VRQTRDRADAEGRDARRERDGPRTAPDVLRRPPARCCRATRRGGALQRGSWCGMSTASSRVATCSRRVPPHGVELGAGRLHGSRPGRARSASSSALEP